ncbi:RNB domain-containing ribonuclease [Kocuria rhizophila]|uniref:RNB domain-containing ribonuclease n=1 Tax=Kocuria rhizophila TaxID=72000 RepID=A0AAX2SF92_KOCRH|nr:RNB domain-containing ribonuclease [Kocuria rhizophila]MBO4144375.1 RNB domain-containing ribonuclease [Kocuria rhizophila]MCT1958198.1 RNB domain-containing ribonuclease [Kocuria rhizophila]MCT2074143.1 RNB domain-containing ribonuclease [Kocuria rhizophila]PMR90015.1 ribonuclease II [Kocuria rhizophila]QTK31013.1 RNB domain-containing ribonuclease [Kocuria rhizophila]
MAIRPQQVHPVPQPLVAALESLRRELAIPDDFPPEVHDAARAAAGAPRLPETDRTDLDLVTIDPEGSRDLDQAVFIEAAGDGFTVWYAIADVAAFVSPGDPVDEEAHRRGQTLYAPHQRTPLHPPELSEDAASLLPDGVRPAVLWRLGLDARGGLVSTGVQRALVRSRAQLSYREVQEQLDAGTAPEALQLLRTVGQLREAVERERGGVSLRIPEQEVVVEQDEWRVVHRSALPVEGWNAQISLLTGIAAARLMLDAGVGLLRVLPPATDSAIRRLRAVASALQIPWPEETSYPEFVRGLDPERGTHAAMLHACTLLFRGAGYEAFEGQPPENSEHSALATPYAHVTAPLRRLVDRYGSEVCLAVAAGRPVPDWVLGALPQLPTEMETSGRRASAYERGIVNMVETLVLSAHVGQEFTATVVDLKEDGSRGTIVIREPAVEASLKAPGLRLGSEIRVRLLSADVAAGRSEFEPVTGSASR